MRKVIVIGVIAAAALAIVAGTILAQDTGSTSDEATAWLGVAVVESDDQVIIARVQSGSPADAADLLIGDVVVSFGGTAIASISDLSELVRAAAPGDTVTLALLRNGESLSVDVTLGSAPTAVKGYRFGRGLVVPVDALSAAERLLYADLEEAEGGFEVVDVYTGFNPFDLENADIVTTINGQNITELDLSALVNDLAAMDDPVLTIQVLRSGEEITLDSDLFGGRFGFGSGPGGAFGRHGRFGFEFGLPLPNTNQEAVPSTSSTGQA